MADLDTAKFHWNSVISTKDARYMCLDIKNFYLTAALEYYEYMKMPLTLFPTWIVEQYDLNKHALHGFVHLEMQRAVWGLPQAGILANKCLRRKLAPLRYYESTHTPGLWYHKSRLITFTLVVDNFGVKYVSKDKVNHLITSIKKDYTFTEDWSGDLYCGMQLDWDYDKRTMDTSMPGYAKKKFQEYGHVMKYRIQTCPHSPEPKKLALKHKPPSPPTHCQNWMVRASNMSSKWLAAFCVMHGLSTWPCSVEQMNATEKIMARCTQLLDYLLHNVDGKVCFIASNMILNIHSNASYLSEAKAWSRACGIFFMGWMPKKWRTHSFEWSIPCQLNDPEICRHVRGRSQTRRVISQLPNGHNFQTHAVRNGTPSTKNTGTLQQCYGGRNSE